jgi:hypothetical protein
MREMFRRVEGRDAVSADGLFPFMHGKFKSVFAVNGLPDQNFGRLGVEDQPVEIKDQVPLTFMETALRNLKLLPKRESSLTPSVLITSSNVDRRTHGAILALGVGVVVKKRV